MKFFIQQYWSESLSLNAQTVANCLLRVGYTLHKFREGHILKGFKDSTPIRGRTRAVESVFESHFGRAFPWFDIPEDYRKVSGRNFLVTDLKTLIHRGSEIAKGLVRRGSSGSTRVVWVKPVRSKLFHATCLIPTEVADWARNMATSLRMDDPINGDTKVFVSQGCYFGDEIRVYMTNHGKSVFIRGREVPLSSPDSEFKETRLEEFEFALPYLRSLSGVWKDCPYAFPIDISGKVGRKGGSIVEVNSLLCSGVLPMELDSCKTSQKNFGVVFQKTWESYARYGRTGSFMP